MAIQGHIYKTKLLKKAVRPLKFFHVNSLESALNHSRWGDRPAMISFNDTKVYNVQNNFVQGKKNGAFEANYSIGYMNKRWLEGAIIDTAPIYGMKPKQAHGPVEYRFIDN